MPDLRWDDSILAYAVSVAADSGLTLDDVIRLMHDEAKDAASVIGCPYDEVTRWTSEQLSALSLGD